MRKLDRARIAVPVILSDPDGKGKQETNLAIKFFGNKDWEKQPAFEFRAYLDDNVKKAVSDLSYNKCAYCETVARAGFDSDIEHFRPKGEIINENGLSIKPGYYWLAADWENLFLSCQHCNQSRKQPTLDHDVVTMGKKNQFPLSDERKRLRSPEMALLSEEPYRLLINPCIDDPGNYLKFDEHGMIYPTELPDGTQNLMGESSVKVFGLHRKYLVEARKTHAIVLMGALLSYKDQVKLFDKNQKYLPPDLIMENEIKLEASIKNVKLFAMDDHPFSAMCHQIIQAFLTREGITIK